MHHITRDDWLSTPDGDPRGYIQPGELRELWFHTGTKCNLQCPFCLEGSGPLATRLQDLSFEEVRPFMDEGLVLGVQQFSFTGGEPFVNKDMIKMLRYGLEHRPCLVLTNGSKPLRNRLEDIKRLQELPHPVRFRVSLDSPDPEKHDAGRGPGQFNMAMESLAILNQHGFEVSIARLTEKKENAAKVDDAFREHFTQASLPSDTNIVPFPDFHLPEARVEVPQITENCMTTYKDENTRREFMCYYSKMIVKRQHRVRVYACTLVDDNPDYDLGGTLTESMKIRVMLKHHRCYACFSCGASCSEPTGRGTLSAATRETA